MSARGTFKVLTFNVGQLAPSKTKAKSLADWLHVNTPPGCVVALQEAWWHHDVFRRELAETHGGDTWKITRAPRNRLKCVPMSPSGMILLHRQLQKHEAAQVPIVAPPKRHAHGSLEDYTPTSKAPVAAGAAVAAAAAEGGGAGQPSKFLDHVEFAFDHCGDSSAQCIGSDAWVCKGVMSTALKVPLHEPDKGCVHTMATVCISNTHLQASPDSFPTWWFTKEGEARAPLIREAQLRSIRTFLNAHGDISNADVHVLAGDLNIRGDDESEMAQVSRHFGPHFLRTGSSTHEAGLELDYISHVQIGHDPDTDAHNNEQEHIMGNEEQEEEKANNSFQVRRVGVHVFESCSLSDHFPVLAEFEVHLPLEQ